ncbi:MAG: PEP-CTERM sorting domain-containing protein [Planctomycetia bacterium]|nr:PEP-CTERM sorting domain-containing protein [Planctomycetia bacterium]
MYFHPPPQFNIVVLGILFLAGVLPGWVVADHYWYGGTDNNWNTAANWSSSSSSYTPVTSAPVSGTTVRFLNTDSIMVNFSDSASGRIYIDGDSQVEFASGSLKSGRIRVGGNATTVHPVWTISGGEISADDGYTVGAATPATWNITGGKITTTFFFNLHAGASKTFDTATVCNMSGGVVIAPSGTHIGECGYGIMNQTGGVFYGTGNAFIGSNGGNSENGNGYWNVGTEVAGKYTGTGEVYIAGDLHVGGAANSTRVGHLALYSGLLSARTIMVGAETGCDTVWKGGTLVNSRLEGNMTNEGSTIEMANDFSVTQAKIDSLADGETFFEKYQDGQIGTWTVTGTFAQTDGRLIFDIASDTHYDQLVADTLDISGGILEVQLLEDYFPTQETFYDLFSANTVTSLDLSLLVPGNAHQWSVTSDGRLHYQTADQVPEPSSWILLSGLFLWGMYCRWQRKKS